MLQAETGLGVIARAALAKRDLSALEAMLQGVAKTCEAFGAVLWQLRIDGEQPPSTGLDILSRPGTLNDLEDFPHNPAKLFVLAQGFIEPDIRCAYHDLPLTTPSGEAILKGESQSSDFDTDETILRNTEFVRNAKPGSLFAVRLKFDDGTAGVLTIYRRQKGELSEEAKDRIRQIGRENLNTLYAAILDRVNYSLVEATSRCLDQAGDSESNDPMQCIANIIARTLKCEEASIFLENSQEEIDKFEVRATSRRELLFRDSFCRNDPGLTALVARSQRPLLVFDLRSVPEYLREKTGFDRDDEVQIRVRRVLAVPEGIDLPPSSFVAVPIPAGSKTVGVLRCQLRPQTPHYFSESDVELLGIVAARIGSYWSRWLRQRESEITNKLWEGFVSDINKLESHLGDLAAKARRVQVNREFLEEIFLQALTALKSSIRGADILDVALVEPDRKYIQQFVMLKDSLQCRASMDPQPPLVRLPLNPAQHNSWAHIFLNYKQRTFFIADTGKPEMPYREMYHGVKQAIFAPVIADNTCVGILSLRSSSVFRDPEKAKSMASLVALQVALYYQLITVLAQQSRTYHDMGHQLRTPVFQARKRIRWLVDKSEYPSYDLLAVNGLMAKTQRVLSNMRLYEELAVDNPVTARKASNSIDTLIKLLYEACVDNQALWASRSIAFRLDRDSFERLRITTLQYDSALLEQVINNLLDNAGKYSEQGSEVTVAARTDHSNRWVEIAFRNQAGIRIEKDELSRLGERGYRSLKAARRTTEGSGIGLFLAKRIMEAHKGDLVVTETDPLGINKIIIGIPY